jgi:hypothetical protein
MRAHKRTPKRNADELEPIIRPQELSEIVALARSFHCHSACAGSDRFVGACSDSDVVANRASPVLRPRMNLALHFEPIANFDDQRRFIAYAAILQLVLRSAQQEGVRDEKERSDWRTRGSGPYREIAENRLQHATAAA